MHNYQNKEKWTFLGSGATSQVFKAQTLKGHFVAIKSIMSKFCRGPELSLIKKEIEILSKLRSLYVVKMVEYFYDERRNLYIVLEYCNGGNLAQYVEEHSNQGRRLEERQVVKFMEQILVGFKAMVQTNCMHRDLKAENILLHNFDIKIADFGGSLFLDSAEDKRTTYFGSPVIMSPQRRNGQHLTQSYGLKSIVYSLGCIFYFMLFGKYPIEESPNCEVWQRKYRESNISAKCKDFLKLTLEDSTARELEWDELWEFRFKESTYKSKLQEYINQYHAKRKQPQLDTISILPEELEDEEPQLEVKKCLSGVQLFSQLQSLRTLYLQAKQTIIFPLYFIENSLRLLDPILRLDFRSYYVLILKNRLDKLTRLQSEVETCSNKFSASEELFELFLKHQVNSEVYEAIKESRQIINEHFLSYKLIIKSEIDEQRGSESFMKLLESNNQVNNLITFKTVIINFCLKIDQIKAKLSGHEVEALTKSRSLQDIKNRILLLQYVLLTLLLPNSMTIPNSTLTNLIALYGTYNQSQLTEIVQAMSGNSNIYN